MTSHYLPTLLTFLLISSTLAVLNPSFSTIPSLLTSIKPSAIKPASKNSDNVPIYKDKTGFYVNVDLQYDSSNSDVGPNTVPFMLGLYTAQTLLIDKCLSFSRYDCDKYHCKPTPQDVFDLNYLYFTAFTYWAGTPLYLDYTNWGYQSTSIIATSCFAKALDSFGQDRYGILGLGTSLTGKQNFNASSPVFSILIKNDSKSGELLFRKDLNYAVSETPETVIEAGSNWIAPIIGNLQVENYSTALNVNLIFDLSSNAIGLPLGVYNKIIEYLGNFGVTDCDAESIYLPVCKYERKSEEHLPNITIVTKKMKLVIPEAVYVLSWDETKENTVRLNFKALSNDLTGPSFVTRSYENYIVLDSRFMSYYYTVFEWKGDAKTAISLYKAGTPIERPGERFWKILLIGSVVLVVVIIVVCCVHAIKKKKSKVFSGHESIQTPFAVNE